MAAKNKRHRQGGKIGGSHTTITEASSRIVDVLNKDSQAQKIVLGRINPISIRNGLRRLKIQDMSGALKLTVFGHGTFQDIYVYSPDTEDLKTRISDFARANGYITRQPTEAQA